MITTRSLAVLGLLLAAGFGLFGFQIIQAVQRGRAFDKYLTVRGAAEEEVKATLAIWPLRFSVAEEDLPTLKSSMEASRQKVHAYLKSYGIAEPEISVGLPSINDRQETYYPENAPRLPRYKAVVTLVVRSKQVDVVKKAIQEADALLEAGIALAGNEYSDRPDFLFDGINDVKPGLVAEATANARLSAEKFARDSAATVGAIRKATQGVLEINDRDAASPEIKVLRVVTTVEFFLE